MSAGNYGYRYWRINVLKDPLDPTYGEEPIYIHADRLEVSASGALLAWGGFRATLSDDPGIPFVVASFAPGQWFSFFAASTITGAAVCAQKL